MMIIMTVKTFEDVTEFHGHLCPGSAIGYKAAIIAIEKLNINPSKDEEIVAIVENDSCAVDSIQVVLSCTFGKGNLIFKDYGKFVFTFINRENEKSVRLAMKKSFNPAEISPKFFKLREKSRHELLSEEEQKLSNELNIELCNHIINMKNDEIFDINEDIEVAIPRKAMIYKSIECDDCGELTAENKLTELNNEQLCIPCFEKKKN